MRLLRQGVEAPRPCSYLDDQVAALAFRVQLDTSAEAFEAMLVRGWRRFGPTYFRPACPSCRACVPTRVPVADFVPSKSQRRARRVLERLRIEVGPPRIDEARLALYARWHAEREAARGWTAAAIDADEYGLQFAFPHPAVREIAYWLDGPAGPRLVGLGIADLTPNAVSAVYFFHEPELASWSLGIANVLHQIDLARRLGRRHVYLGYWVVGCASMAYKAAFRPQERLERYVESDEEPAWVRAALPP